MEKSDTKFAEKFEHVVEAEQAHHEEEVAEAEAEDPVRRQLERLVVAFRDANTKFRDSVDNFADVALRGSPFVATGSVHRCEEQRVAMQKCFSEQHQKSKMNVLRGSNFHLCDPQSRALSECADRMLAEYVAMMDAAMGNRQRAQEPATAKE